MSFKGVAVFTTLLAFSIGALTGTNPAGVPTWVSYSAKNGLIRFEGDPSLTILASAPDPVARSFPGGKAAGLYGRNGQLYLQVLLNPNAPGSPPVIVLMVLEVKTFALKWVTQNFTIPDAFWDFSITGDGKRGVIWSKAHPGYSDGLITLVDLVTGATSRQNISLPDNLEMTTLESAGFDPTTNTLFWHGRVHNTWAYTYYAFGIDGKPKDKSNIPMGASSYVGHAKYSPKFLGVIGSARKCVELAAYIIKPKDIWCAPGPGGAHSYFPSDGKGTTIAYTPSTDMFFASAKSQQGPPTTTYIRVDFTTTNRAGPWPIATYVTERSMLQAPEFLAPVT